MKPDKMKAAFNAWLYDNLSEIFCKQVREETQPPTPRWIGFSFYCHK